MPAGMETQVIAVPLRGMDEGVDDRWLEPGQATVLQNVVVRKGGRLSKRRGFDPVTTTDMPSNAHSLVRVGEQACAISAYDAKLFNGSSWEDFPNKRVGSFGAIEETVVVGNLSGSLARRFSLILDGVYKNGYDVVAWVEDDTAGYAVRDASTGEEVLASTFDGTQVRLVECGDYVCLFWCDHNDNSTLRVICFDLSGTPVVDHSGTLAGVDIEDGTTPNKQLFDTFQISASQCGVAYTRDTGLPSYEVSLLLYTPSTQSGTQKGSNVAAGDDPSTDDRVPIAAAYNSDVDRTLVLYRDAYDSSLTANNNNFSALIYNHGTDSWSSPFSIGSADFTRLIDCVYVQANPDAPSNVAWTLAISGMRRNSTYNNRDLQTLWYTIATTGLESSTWTTGMVPAAKGFDLGETPNVNSGQADVVTPLYPVEFGAGSVVGVHTGTTGTQEPLAEAFAAAGPSALNADSFRNGAPATSSTDGTSFYFYVAVANYFEKTVGTTEYTARAVRVKWTPAPTLPVPRLESDRFTLAGNATLNHFDREYAWVNASLAPPYLTTSGQDTSGGQIDMTSGESYLLAARYFYVDGNGEEHRGPLSQLLTEVASSTDSSSSIYFQSVHHNGSGSFVIYRSLPNESTLRRTGLGFDLRPDLTTVITKADSDVDDNESISTRELNQWAPYGVTSIALAGERIWIVANGRVRFSKLKLPGFAWEFAEENAVQMPGAYDPVAVAELDGTPIVFTENEVFAVSGLGPDNNGLNGDFTLQRVTADVGCKNPRSVVSTPLGIIFQSERGFRLLDRSYQIARGEGGDFWGSEVDDVGQACTPVAVVTRPDEDEVLWLLDGSHDGGEGEEGLVYNIEADTWSVCRYGFTPQDATIVDGVVYVLGAAGTLYVEQSDAIENGAHVPISVETGWFSPAGLEGYANIRSIMLSLRWPGDKTNLVIDIKTDDASGWTQTVTYTKAQLDALANPNSLQIIPNRSVHRASRIKLRISDNASGISAAEGPQIVGLAYEVGLFPKATRVNKAARKG